jgi:preprotein translocase subunit SecD
MNPIISFLAMRYEGIALIALVIFLAGCAKDKTEYSKGKTFDLYPAIEGKLGDKNCQNFYGQCLLFQTKRPVLQLNDFKFQAVPKDAPDKNNQINIALSTHQSWGLEAISEKYSGEGKRLAIVYEHKILHAPKLRGRFKTDKVTIDFCNEQLYEILLAVLRGKTPLGYNFNTDAAVRVCFDRPRE